MATPFSPFVGRQMKPGLKRRQSELPSDLIDWDAPEIPELEKQRIIYEDYIKELQEDHEVETILNEQLYEIAHVTMIEEYQQNAKKLEDELTKERSRVHLLLGQLKMFETNVKESEERVEELENEVANHREAIANIEQEKEIWIEERNGLQVEIENLNFKNNEMAIELDQHNEMYRTKKREVEDLEKKLQSIKTRLDHYKQLAKNKIHRGE